MTQTNAAGLADSTDIPGHPEAPGDSAGSDTRIPVLILTGFLGAGKTTVLQQMLVQPAWRDHAVLINEFGEVGIDQQLVTPIAPDAVLLDSGCICCQIRGELKDALQRLLDQRAEGSVPRFRGIVIETTGLAEPTPIIATLQADPVLSHQLRIDRTVTVVDAVNGSAMMKDGLLTGAQHVNGTEAGNDGQLRPLFGGYGALAREGCAIWWQQVAAADVVLLSKSDLDPAAGEALQAALVPYLPGVPVITHAPQQPLPAWLVPQEAFAKGLPRSQGARGPGGGELIPAVPSSAGGVPSSIQSVVLTADTPVDWVAFGVWLSALLHVHGRAVLRVKGVLDIGENHRVLVNGVQHQVYPPQHLAAPSGALHRSVLVLIVAGIDPATILPSFQHFVHAGAVAAS